MSHLPVCILSAMGLPFWIKTNIHASQTNISHFLDQLSDSRVCRMCTDTTHMCEATTLWREPEQMEDHQKPNSPLTAQGAGGMRMQASASKVTSGAGMLTLTNTQATLWLAGLLLSQRLRRHWMINYPPQSRANPFPICETPAVLTLEWIYTHSSRAKGGWLVENEHRGQVLQLKCEVSLGWCYFLFLPFFGLFFCIWPLWSQCYSRASVTQARKVRWDWFCAVCFVLLTSIS